MTDPIITNFKLMIQYICKVASTNSTCPLSETALSFVISWIFNDEERVSKIVSKYKSTRDALNIKYQTSNTQYKSYRDALLNKDRSLFEHIELFPKNISKEYESGIKWFSSFLTYDMEDHRLEYVWRYLKKIDEQAG